MIRDPGHGQVAAVPGEIRAVRLARSQSVTLVAVPREPARSEASDHLRSISLCGDLDCNESGDVLIRLKDLNEASIGK